LLRTTINDIQKNGGGTAFGYYVQDPQSYGVVEFDKEGKVLSIEEKPKHPKSHYAIPGLYFYDNHVIRIAKGIKPSWRGELEITDVNKKYLEEGTYGLNRLEGGLRGLIWELQKAFWRQENLLRLLRKDRV